MRTIFSILGVCILLGDAMPAIAEPQPQKPRERQVLDRSGLIPIGSLGHPLGDLLLLEGKRAEYIKSGDRMLRIEKINGVLLEKPKFISIENLPLPAGTPCAIYGYETMQMAGMAPAYEQLAKLKGEPAPPHPQTGWQISCTFWAIEVKEPKTLEIPPVDADYRMRTTCS